MAEIDLADVSAIKRRITSLQRGEYQDHAFYSETYGLGKDALEGLLPQMKQWAERSSKRAATREAEISRFVFEQFLAFFKLLTPALAAARMGMDAASLERMVDYAKESLGVPSQAIGLGGAAYREDFFEGLHSFFPALRSRVFSSHTSYCKALHAAFIEEGVQITPRYDPVSLLLGEPEPDLAHDLDIVTCGPIGLRFSVWLGFGKPFSLEPDKTSALTFVRYREVLEPSVPDYFSADGDLLARIEGKLAKAA